MDCVTGNCIQGTDYMDCVTGNCIQGTDYMDCVTGNCKCNRRVKREVSF